MLKSFKYVVYREDKYYVSQCLNVDVSSFGDTIDEAIVNLQEALELYYEDDIQEKVYVEIDQVMMGETQVNA